jgi:hypothetical protein
MEQCLLFLKPRQKNYSLLKISKPVE